MSIEKINLKEFTNDILNLYCKTRVSDIENVFIKLANIEINNFWKWLSKNNRLRSSLANSSVYDALDILSHIRSIFSYGQIINKGLVIKTLHENSKSLKTIPIFITMSGLVDNNATKEILHPYRDIIEVIKEKFPYENPLDESDIIADISMIKELYLKNNMEDERGPIIKETIDQKRNNMVKYLLTKFNDDISMAAISSGMPELASGIRDGILAKPFTSGLNEYLNLDNYDSSSLSICNELSKYILSKPRYEAQWGDHNYNTITMILMNKAGSLSSEDMHKIIEDYERKTNPIDMLGKTKQEMYVGYDLSGKITIDKKINPVYLFLVSTFFVRLRQNAGLPTGFTSKAQY